MINTAAKQELTIAQVAFALVLMTKFVELGSAKALDASCVASIKRVPFTPEPPQLAVIQMPETEMQKYAGRFKGEDAPGYFLDFELDGGSVKRITMGMGTPDELSLVPAGK